MLFFVLFFFFQALFSLVSLDLMLFCSGALLLALSAVACCVVFLIIEFWLVSEIILVS